MALAVADTLTLLIAFIQPYGQLYYNKEIEYSFFICKINHFLRSVFIYNANWLIIVFTIFRVIAVYLPHKPNIYCTKTRAYIAITLTFIFSMIAQLDSIIHIHHVPIYDTNRTFIHNQCSFDGSRLRYFTYYIQWEITTIMAFTPFTVLIIGNSMIIYKMAKYKLE